MFGEKNSNDWVGYEKKQGKSLNEKVVNIVVEKNSKCKTKDPSSVWSGRIKRKEYVSGCTALHCTCAQPFLFWAAFVHRLCGWDPPPSTFSNFN